MPTDLILYALIAAGLVFWLKTILGTRHGEERERPNPFSGIGQGQKDRARPAPLDDVIDDGMAPIFQKPVLPRNVTIASAGVEKSLEEIAKADPGFDLSGFATAVQDAFAIIVESFGSGDRDTLKNLLEPKVYAAFDGALAQREKEGHTMSTEIHAIRRVEIMDASVQGDKAYVTLRFVADETCVVKSSDGAILSGNPDRITEMNDIWVFAKPVKSRDPRWFLSETRDGDVREDSKTPFSA